MTTLGSGAVLCGLDPLQLPRPLLPHQAAEGFAGGQLLGHLEFLNEGPVEMETAFGSELDGRLFTSLADLTDRNLVTPEEKFYLRTRASRILPDAAGWTVTVDGLAAKQTIAIAELRSMEKPQGLHLMECSGNTRTAQFGMISMGDWAGVPFRELLARLGPSRDATSRSPPPATSAAPGCISPTPSVRHW